MSKRLIRWISLVGIDFHVSTALLMRGWTIVAGGIMVFIIPATLSPEQQGYYFTFASLLGLQIFFELGLNQVITQITSKEMALREQGTPDAAAIHLERIRSTLSKLRKWYRIAAAMFLVVTLLAGIGLFWRDGGLPMKQWLGPLIGLTTFTAINLYFSPLLAVTEGCGHIGQVAKLRLAQSVIGFSLTWICLFSGAGLWAIPVNAIVASIWTSRWLRRENIALRVFGDFTRPSSAHAIDWRREVFPFQWRIAVSWMSGYLMYQLFTPFVFIHLGSVTAGRLGFTIAIFTAIQSLGVSWFNARIPAMAGLISQAKRTELNQLFRVTFVSVSALTLVGCSCVFAAVALMGHIYLGLDDRLVDTATMVVIALGTIGNTMIYGAATYMRAHGEEPMLPVSLTAGIMTLTAAYISSQFGTFLTMLSQTVITFVVVAPWTAFLFNKYSRQ
jgi:hypothetical protein